MGGSNDTKRVDLLRISFRWETEETTLSSIG